MTLSLAINHKFVDPHADGADTTLVRPTNWNDTHAIQIGGVDADLTGSGSTLALASAPTFAGQVKITMPASGTSLFINGNTAGEIAGGHRASIHVQGPDGENCGFHADAFGAATNPTFFGRHALGTAALPLAETADTLLVRFAGRGYRTNSYSNNVGGMGVFAAGTFTDASTPTYTSIFTCPVGSTDTQIEVARGQPGGGLSVGDAAWNATDRPTGVLAVKTSVIIGAGAAITSSGAGGTLGTNAFSSTAYAPLASPTFAGLVTINNNTAASPGTILSPALVIQAADATRTALELQTYGTGAQTFARIAQRRFGGTAAAPAATPAAAVLGNNTFGGWDGSVIASGAVILATAINLWSGSDRSAFLDFQVTASGSNSLLTQLRLNGSGGAAYGNANIATDPGSGGVLATFFRAAGVVFASLPTAVAGIFAYITDSNTATWGATIAGGGANKVLGWYNGTNWTVVAA